MIDLKSLSYRVFKTCAHEAISPEKKIGQIKIWFRRYSVLGANARSPGKTSPAGMIGSREGTGIGRTMKEYEDQLEALKKENFNLKLRIYFLEERMGITSADENAIKKNIELKVSYRIQNLPSLNVQLPNQSANHLFCFVVRWKLSR